MEIALCHRMADLGAWIKNKKKKVALSPALPPFKFIPKEMQQAKNRPD